jgi:hypothetical protein
MSLKNECWILIHPYPSTDSKYSAWEQTWEMSETSIEMEMICGTCFYIFVLMISSKPGLFTVKVKFG